MNESELYQSRLTIARIAGFFYAILALAFLPQMLRDRLIVAGDAAATGQNLLASAQLFRLSILGDIVCYVAFLLLAIYLYSLLEGVGPVAARSMVGLVLVCICVALVGFGNELTALALFQSGDSAGAMRFLGLFEDGMLIAEVFMGLWLFPLGWLFFKSGFMPRTLGLLLMAGCFGYLVDAFAGLVMPEWRALTKNAVMLPALAELATVLWLLAFGVKRPAQQMLRKVAT